MGVLWVRSMGQRLLCGRCGSDLWGRSCCGAYVGQIYMARAAVGHMWVRPMGQVLLCDICGSDLWGRSCCGAHVGQIYGA